MPTHQPTHLCCCGGSSGGGHHPSAPGHSYPEVDPEVGVVALGGLTASEVLSVSCGKRVVRSSPPSLLLSHRRGRDLSKARLGRHHLTTWPWEALSISRGLPSLLRLTSRIYFPLPGMTCGPNTTTSQSRSGYSKGVMCNQGHPHSPPGVYCSRPPELSFLSQHKHMSPGLCSCC